MSTTRESRQAYRRLPHVREQERAYRKAYRETHREQERAASRTRYQKNIEKERQRAKARNAKHPESMAKAQKKYRTIHADKLRAYSQRYYAAFREALNQYKLAYGCCDCGYKGHPAALDFDHIDGTKAKEVSLCGSIESALEEARKCQIRCANCHRIRTFNQQSYRKTSVVG